MDMRRVWAVPAITLVAVVVACGGEAESAADAESERLPALEAPAPEAPVERALPAPAPAPTQAPRSPAPAAPAPAPAPNPVDPRPEIDRTVPPLAVAREVRALEAGRTLELRMDTPLSTESSQPGAPFQATLGEDVLGIGGEVLLPLGSRLTGRVSESRKSEREGEPAVLGLEFLSVTVGGVPRPLRATILEVEMRAEDRDSNRATAAKVGVGAAAGAVVGQILGRDTRSTLQGAVVGTVAGTAVALATRDGHAVIEPGARVVIRLDERLIVED